MEIQFALRGKTLPADHGYSLYSAIKKNHLKGQSLPDEVLLCSVPGFPDRDGMIYLNHSSRLRLRCPHSETPAQPDDWRNYQFWYRHLQNTVLDVDGHLIRLVRPQLTLPQPSPTLKARLVTFKLKDIKNSEIPAYFLESCQKVLARLDIQAQVFIDSNADGDLARRAITIKKKKQKKSIVGYGVVVEGLSPEDSLKLQCYGMGGRKHFGCGWFYPAKGEENAA